VPMNRPVLNPLRAATTTQRIPLAIALLIGGGLATAWIVSYRHALELHLTLHERYCLRCETGDWQWMVISYSELIRFDTRTISKSPVLTVQVPVVVNDARKLAWRYKIPGTRFREWWPCIQNARAYQLTITPYVGRLNVRGPIVAPIIMQARTGVDARVLGTPCWLPLACVGVLGILLLWRMYARAQVSREGHCRNCGYDLRMTPQRCPECGMAPPESSGTRN
jgi:hypothetical protein